MARAPRPAPEVLAGKLDARFAWPPSTEADVRAFEASMAAGCPPIIEALRAARGVVFGGGKRWLDVGGGDGVVAAELLRDDAELRADVFNLPSTAALVRERARAAQLETGSGSSRATSSPGPARGLRRALVRARAPRLARGDRAHAAARGETGARARRARIVVCEFRTRDGSPCSSSDLLPDRRRRA
jgi:hypothetical protein